MSGATLGIEGPDGSGKGTQAELLVARLRDAGYAVHYFDFPQYETTFFGGMVGEMLSGQYGPMKSIDPHLASLPYAFDRWTATPFINEVRESGGIAVLNRFSMSNAAHQSARVPREKRGDFLKFLTTLENELLGVPVPDLYIYLDVPTEISQKLIAEKAKRKYLEGNGMTADQLEEDIAHQMEAARMYKELSVTMPNVIRIGCCDGNGALRQKEDIHNEVWRVTCDYLSTRTIEGQIKGTERYS